MPSVRNYKELNKIERADKWIFFRVMGTIIPGILLGGYIGQKMAQFFEVCDLFTPDVVENDD
ncbi:hypothetical protein KR054_005133 [Drosophila jambulina]|nr:hypothetical protein KR054_005133 [Drosophila jambulina]